MNSGGLVLIIVGVWVLSQLFFGGLLSHVPGA